MREGPGGVWPAGSRGRWPQEQHVVRVDHRGVGLGAVRFPGRPAVEAGQRPGPDGHAREPTDPHEPVRLVQVTELADDRHAGRLLALDELPVEKLDQYFSLARPQRVLPQFHDRIPYAVHQRLPLTEQLLLQQRPREVSLVAHLVRLQCLAQYVGD